VAITYTFILLGTFVRTSGPIRLADDIHATSSFSDTFKSVCTLKTVRSQNVIDLA
jgi:hypothetical protein